MIIKLLSICVIFLLAVVGLLAYRLDYESRYFDARINAQEAAIESMTTIFDDCDARIAKIEHDPRWVEDDERTIQ